jgi:hypothetical protein
LLKTSFNIFLTSDIVTSKIVTSNIYSTVGLVNRRVISFSAMGFSIKVTSG